MKSNQEFRERLADLRLPSLVEQSLILFAEDGIEPREIKVTASREQAAPVNQEGPAVRESGFKFGRKSATELDGVLPALNEVARLALRRSTQDFMIFDGLRTEAEQRAYVRRGVSRTMNSKHMRQGDGFSHAFDAVPVVGTIPKWDWNLIWPVAFAVDQAATELGCAHRIRWGGAWDRTLADFGGNVQAYKRETELYASRHPGKDFLDGPHFEWIS